jgi:hypothetical protein
MAGFAGEAGFSGREESRHGPFDRKDFEFPGLVGRLGDCATRSAGYCEPTPAAAAVLGSGQY